jgi:hypothetical protein
LTPSCCILLPYPCAGTQCHGCPATSSHCRGRSGFTVVAAGRRTQMTWLAYSSVGRCRHLVFDLNVVIFYSVACGIERYRECGSCLLRAHPLRSVAADAATKKLGVLNHSLLGHHHPFCLFNEIRWRNPRQPALVEPGALRAPVVNPV